MDDVNDDIDPDSSLSEISTNETEDNFVINDQQLIPIIKERVNAWPEKGIQFQIQTIDRGVSVEEWLMANQEFTTTTKKSKTTVINKANTTTTVTTETTRTTTMRKSINVVRNQAKNGNQVKAITNGEFTASSSPKDDKRIENESKKPKERKEKIETQIQGLFADGLISSKRFSCLSKPGKQSTLNVNKNVGRQNMVTSPKKVKRLSPQKMRNMRSRIKSLPTEAEKIHSTSEIVPNEIAVGLDNEDVVDNTKPVQEQKQNRKTSKSKKSKRLSPQKKRNRIKSSPTEAEKIDTHSEVAEAEKINTNPEVMVSLTDGAFDSEMISDKPVQDEPRNPKTGKSKKVKRLSPQKKKNRKKSPPTEAEKINANPEVVVSNGIDGVLESEIVFDRPVPGEPQNPKRGNSNKASDVPKSRPEIVVYSANAGEEFGTKIDNEFISVAKEDIENRIDLKYHRQHFLNSMKNCIVPVNQNIVYVPPMNDTTMQNNDGSESDDDLLTSYTRTGHLCRLILK